jgi:hypothetical protein
LIQYSSMSNATSRNALYEGDTALTIGMCGPVR